MISLLLVLQSVYLPLQDSVALKATADSFGVNVEVVYAVAWMESRRGDKWNRLGPGVIDSTWLPDGTLRVRRVCRELGRFQLRSCYNWNKMLHVSGVCSYERLRNDYSVGVHCGVRNLRRLWNLHGDWVEVIRRQNGSGPLSRVYLKEALAYIGWRRLNANPSEP